MKDVVGMFSTSKDTALSALALLDRKPNYIFVSETGKSNKPNTTADYIVSITDFGGDVEAAAKEIREIFLVDGLFAKTRKDDLREIWDKYDLWSSMVIVSETFTKKRRRSLEKKMATQAASKVYKPIREGRLHARIAECALTAAPSLTDMEKLMVLAVALTMEESLSKLRAEGENVTAYYYTQLESGKFRKGLKNFNVALNKEWVTSRALDIFKRAGNRLRGEDIEDLRGKIKDALNGLCEPRTVCFRNEAGKPKRFTLAFLSKTENEEVFEASFIFGFLPKLYDTADFLQLSDGWREYGTAYLNLRLEIAAALPQLMHTRKPKQLLIFDLFGEEEVEDISATSPQEERREKWRKAKRRAKQNEVLKAVGAEKADKIKIVRKQNTVTIASVSRPKGEGKEEEQGKC